MKKWLSGLLALAMLLTVCAGCGKTNTGDSAAKDDGPAANDGIYYDITGVHADEPMLTINGRQIPSEQYFYWLAYQCSDLEYTILAYYNYYGYYAELVDSETMTLKWDYEGNFYNGMTLPEFAMYSAENTILFYTMLEEAADKYGAQPDEADLAAIAQARENAVAELGGEEEYAEYLQMLGISSDYFDQLTRSGYIFDNLVEQVLTEGSDLYLPDSGYDDYATYADHILIATKDLATGAALSEDEKQAKTALAQDLLSRLQAVEGQELLDLFAQLADTYSEDTGRATNPTGYIYTPGTMVSEFENAASALAPGQISGLVESTYGYHIILRRDLAEGLAANSQQKTALADEHLRIQLNQMSETAKVERSDVLSSLDVAVFYSEYSAIIEALTAEAQAEADAAIGEPQEK